MGQRLLLAMIAREKRVLAEFLERAEQHMHVDARFRSRLLDAEVRRRLVYYPRALDAAIYMRQNLNKPIRLGDVAAHVGMSACAFSHYFTEKIGVTFSTFVKLLRIERALEELERSDSSISELAGSIGYQSCCSFSKVFKEVVGQTPSEYRRIAITRTNGAQSS